MKLPKLVAIDLDGTVLDNRGCISQRTKAAIAAIRRAGTQVVIVTFRAYRSSKPYALELGLHVPLICVNGALVKDASNDRVLEEFPVPSGAARAAVEYGIAKGFDTCLFVGECYVGNADVIRKYGDGWEHQWVRSDNLRDALDSPTLMVRFFGDHRFEEARRDLRYLGLEEVDDWLGDIFELTFMQKGVSKRFALERFSADLGIAREDVMAIGDGALDAGMIAWAGRGVAMENAAPETLAAADEVTLSNDEDGVALVLERLINADKEEI
jgi:Cof subfamily protein (haloacid dehalogenase superfamily)